jgi:hypothetical protein
MTSQELVLLSTDATGGVRSGSLIGLTPRLTCKGAGQDHAAAAIPTPLAQPEASLAATTQKTLTPYFLQGQRAAARARPRLATAGLWSTIRCRRRWWRRPPAGPGRRRPWSRQRGQRRKPLRGQGARPGRGAPRGESQAMPAAAAAHQSCRTRSLCWEHFPDKDWKAWELFKKITWTFFKVVPLCLCNDRASGKRSCGMC